MTATTVTELTDIELTDIEPVGTEPAATTRSETAPQHLTPQVRATLVTGTQVHVTAGSHEFTIDEPAGLGGTDLGANPVEHLLAALGACQVITFQVWAGTLGIRLDSVDVQLSGHLDLRGFFGTAEGVRPGFDGIQVDVRITGPETRERYDALVAAVEEHCPVLDNLRSRVPVETVVTVG